MHLVYAIDRLTTGGAQRQVIELAARLSGRDGERVTILCYPCANFFEDRLRGTGVEVVQIAKSGPADLRYPWRLRRWIRANRVDVIHAFMLGPILWSFLATRWLPARLRPAFVPAERNILSGTPAWEQRLKRWIFARASCVTANAQVAADEIRALGVERVVHLPNGIDVEAWQRASAGESPIALDPERFQLALIARIAPQKNQLLVIEALARLGRERVANWRVWLVGDERIHTALAERIDAAITEHGLEDVVRRHGPIREVAAFLRGLDALLLVSSREGFPNVVLEAMTLRVPVVASRVGEAPHMLEDGVSGLLLADPGAESLAAALVRLEGMPAAERAALGAAARARVEECYELGAVVDRHLALYREITRATMPV